MFGLTSLFPFDILIACRKYLVVHHVCYNVLYFIVICNICLVYKKKNAAFIWMPFVMKINYQYLQLNILWL